MKKTLLSILLFSFIVGSLCAQMWNGVDTLYGNEWIHYDQPYFKIKLAEDGIYRLSSQTLSAAGIPVESLQGNQYQLFYFGEEIPLYASTGNGALGAGDYLEFYGHRNRSELDRYLFENPELEMMNPEYSLFSDTSAYFLTWGPVGTPTKRYTELSNDLTNLPGAEAWFWDTLLVDNHGTYISKKYDNSGYVGLSAFDVGEGFGSSYLANFSFELSPEEAVVVNEVSQIQLNIASFRTIHHLRISINGEVVLENEAFPAYEFEQLLIDIPAGLVGAGAINLTVEGLAGANDKFSISNIVLRYPRAFQFSTPARKMTIAPGSGDRYFEITGPSITGNQAVIYGLQGQRLVPEFLDGKLKFKWPAFSEPQDLFLIGDQAAIKPVVNLEPLNFIPIEDLNKDYFMITHTSLRTAADGSDPVADYADYRGSLDGGNFNVAIVDIQDLYDQFAYGVSQHPLSIRNFGAYVHRFFNNPRFIVLVGRGYEYNFTRDENGSDRALNLVPSFGIPASDNLLLATPGKSRPLIPIGRISVRKGEELQHYLRKVMDHEAGFRLSRTVKNFAWRKKALHLVGGKVDEQQTFNNYLNSMGQELMGNQFGGIIQTLKKETAEPVNSSPSGAAILAVNAGVAIKAYLGHGSVVTTEDFAMDDPEVYSNTGKYPLIFSLGCLTGNSFTPQTSISELFVRADQRGAIGYIASSGYGFASALRDLSKEFYSLLGGSMYGKGIGEIMSEVRGTYEDNTWIGISSLVDQLHLHGDPAVRINDLPEPDYLAHFESVRILPEVINTLVDSIEINFDLYNIGAVSEDTMVLKFEHELANGQVQSYFDTIQTKGTITNLTFKLPLKGEGLEGINQLRLLVDADNRIVELPAAEAELNNQMRSESGEINLPFFIFDNTLRPVSPPDFGIVGQPDLVLQASTSDIFAPERSYIFEIDTTATFESPLKERSILRADGGLVTWSPTISLLDSTVYYWRVSPDSMGTTTDLLPWNNSSFLYLEGSSDGWNQSHYYQFSQDELVNVAAVDSLQRLLYAKTNLGVIARAARISAINNTRSRIFLNNDRIVNVTGQPSLAFAVFDPVSGSIWKIIGFRLDQTAKRQDAIRFIRDSIPPDFVASAVTFHSPGQHFGQEFWTQDSLDIGDNLISVLEAQGATKIRDLLVGDSRPYTFAFKKDAYWIGEDLAEEGEENAFIAFDFPGRWDEGQVFSPKIGPSQQWNDLNWAYESTTVPDSVHLSIWGFDSNGQNATLLVDSVGANSLELGSLIDAEQYPYLQLQFFSRDTFYRVAPEIKYWRINYVGMPEIALDPVSFYQDTLQQGETLQLKFDLYNLSNVAVDTFDVRYSIISSNNQRIVKLEKASPIAANSSHSQTFSFITDQILNKNQLLVEANPNKTPLEKNYLNNLGVTSFYVQGDQRNPLLDVTFDGQRILDGDLVSFEPLIQISLTDENEFLTLKDSSLFTIRLRDPNGVLTEVNFSDPRLIFYPANAQGQNRALIEYQPLLNDDGVYELLVQASDVSGNDSGEQDYRIRFEVIHQNSISNLLPYPNPFSTATRFVYTLTGNQEPEYFVLRIMTVSGRIVREISKEEFGPMEIGTHLSDFEWDGTDEFGDRLANGVYLYQVLSRNGDKEKYDHYENGKIDQYFRNGIGKVVLLR